MLPIIFVHEETQARGKAINDTLSKNNLNISNPDLLFFGDDDKLGVAETRKIRNHLSLKPVSGDFKGVVIVSAQNLSLPAQHALLKTLEELPDKAFFLLGVDNENSLLPTILSRCQIQTLSYSFSDKKYRKEIESLSDLNIDQRFELVEKLGDKESFLKELIVFYREKFHKELNLSKFLDQLLEAERFSKANVNIRAILEYLMLILP